MELPFVTLDVFTETRFRGNPVAVVTIPAGGPAPTQAQKQAIARELNLSETVFVHDVAIDAADAAAARRTIDIFLPFAEIAFAGHPTIGTAVALPQAVSCLVTRAGPIAIDRIGPRAVRATIPHDVRPHARCLRALADLPPHLLPANPRIRELELDAPIVSIVKGVSFILTELPDLDLLAQVERGTAAFPVARLLDDGWQTGFLGRYYYVRTAAREGPDGQPVVCLRTRMMEPSFEDPATGSAACSLAAFLSSVKDKQTTPTRRYQVTQGVEMGKESNIVVDVAMKDPDTIDTVKLAGSAVEVMRGHVTV